MSIRISAFSRVSGDTKRKGIAGDKHAKMKRVADTMLKRVRAILRNEETVASGELLRNLKSSARGGVAGNPSVSEARLWYTVLQGNTLQTGTAPQGESEGGGGVVGVTTGGGGGALKRLRSWSERKLGYSTLRERRTAKSIYKQAGKPGPKPEVTLRKVDKRIATAKRKATTRQAKEAYRPLRPRKTLRAPKKQLKTRRRHLSEVAKSDDTLFAIWKSIREHGTSIFHRDKAPFGQKRGGVPFMRKTFNDAKVQQSIQAARNALLVETQDRNIVEFLKATHSAPGIRRPLAPQPRHKLPGELFGRETRVTEAGRAAATGSDGPPPPRRARRAQRPTARKARPTRPTRRTRKTPQTIVRESPVRERSTAGETEAQTIARLRAETIARRQAMREGIGRQRRRGPRARPPGLEDY